MLRAPLISLGTLVALSAPASANGIITPFDYSFALIPANFPVNGLMVLAMYYIFVSFEGLPRPMGTMRHWLTTVLSVGIITFTGSLIDSAMITVDNLLFSHFAAFLIAFIVFQVVHRYLEMPYRWAAATGAVFFFANILMWSMSWESAEELDYYPWALSALWIVFALLSLAVSTATNRRREGEVPGRPISPWSTPQDAPVIPTRDPRPVRTLSELAWVTVATLALAVLVPMIAVVSI